MKLKLKNIAVILFAAINLLVVAAMNLCAYSSLLPPQNYPNWSYFGLLFPAFLAASAGFIVFWLIFKWKLTAISLLGMLACADSVRTYFPVNFPSTPPEGAIKVLSYNIFNFGDYKDIPWEDNPIINYIVASDADIVCIQEATKLDWQPINSIFAKKYPYMSFDIDRMTANACLSKYPILSRVQIDYPSNSNASFAYEVLVGDDTVLVVNNHLESYKLNAEEKQEYKDMIKRPEDTDLEGSYSRLTEKLVAANALRGAQADSLLAFVKRSGRDYVIMCGDFNDSPISYVHRTLTSALDDAYTRSGNGPGLSYNRSGMYFRIDNILISPAFESYGATVDKSIKASDHYPIYCFLKKKKEKD